MAEILHINRRVSIPRSELRFQFTRSGGHGGQNVNKVETRVELYFDVRTSLSLSEEEKEKILRGLGSRADKNGIFRLTVQKSRSQHQNRDIAIARFTELMQKILRPEKKRITTKTPHGAKERRLEEKKRKGIKKQHRRVVLE